MIYAHTLTYPEVLKTKDAVINLQGQMIGGPDMKMIDEWSKWVSWQKAIKFASQTPGTVSPHVMAFFQATKGCTKPPTDEIEDAVLVEVCDQVVAGNTHLQADSYRALNGGVIPPGGIVFDDPLCSGGVRPTTAFKPPRFTWSYTSMQEFLTCPAQWAAKRYYKTIKDVESEAMRMGNLIHETAEHYLKRAIGQSHKPHLIHAQYLPMVQKYCDALVASGAELHVEKEMCFTEQFKPCGWKDWDTVWVRSKGDVLVKKEVRLSVVDWKSGRYKEDFLQLKMFAVFAALTPGFEDVQEFDPKFIFLKEAPPKNILRLPKPILRSELKGVLSEILAVVRRMQEAWASETFPCKKNGLCRNYCANTDCTHCGG